MIDIQFACTDILYCNYSELAFLTKTSKEWSEIFDAAEIWYTPVQNFVDVLEDKQAQAIGSFVPTPGSICTVKHPPPPLPPLNLSP